MRCCRRFCGVHPRGNNEDFETPTMPCLRPNKSARAEISSQGNRKNTSYNRYGTIYDYNMSLNTPPRTPALTRRIRGFGGAGDRQTVAANGATRRRVFYGKRDADDDGEALALDD